MGSCPTAMDDTGSGYSPILYDTDGLTLTFLFRQLMHASDFVVDVLEDEGRVDLAGELETTPLALPSGR